MIASQEGHIHVVSILVDNGAHVNLQNKVPTKILQVCMYVHVLFAEDFTMSLIIVLVRQALVGS